jgi:hypothetical protein
MSMISNKQSLLTVAGMYIQWAPHQAMYSPQAQAGGIDFWVSKVSGTDGSPVWGVQAGTNTDDAAYGIALDSSGDVLICGRTLGSLYAAHVGSLDDYWVAKRSGSDGSLIWGVQLGTTGHDLASAVAVDGNGDVFLTGYTSDSLHGTHVGGLDAWVAKRSGSDGSLIWGKHIGTATTDTGNALAVDSSGNVFITGKTAGVLSGSNAGLHDYWVYKRSGVTGATIWKVQGGTSDEDYANGLAVDSAGDVYLTGYTAGSLYATNAGSRDIWVSRLSGTDGSLVWGVQDGSILDDLSNAMALDNEGNVYATGHTEGGVYVSSTGGHNFWVTKRSGTDGSLTWSYVHEAAFDSLATAVIVDGSGSVITAGYTNGALYGTNFGGNDFWVFKSVASPTGQPSGTPTMLPSSLPSTLPNSPSGYPTGRPTYVPSTINVVQITSNDSEEWDVSFLWLYRVIAVLFVVILCGYIVYYFVRNVRNKVDDVNSVGGGSGGRDGMSAVVPLMSVSRTVELNVLHAKDMVRMEENVVPFTDTEN